MDNFHSGIIEMLGAEYRADALAHVQRARLAHRVAVTPAPSPTGAPRSPFVRWAQLVARASVRQAPAWLRR
jgi:hypothetical protein